MDVPNVGPPVLDPPLTGVEFDPNDIPPACPHFDLVEVAAAEFGRDCVLVDGHVGPHELSNGLVFGVEGEGSK